MSRRPQACSAACAASPGGAFSPPASSTALTRRDGGAALSDASAASSQDSSRCACARRTAAAAAAPAGAAEYAAFCAQSAQRQPIAMSEADLALIMAKDAISTAKRTRSAGVAPPWCMCTLTSQTRIGCAAPGGCSVSSTRCATR